MSRRKEATRPTAGDQVSSATPLEHYLRQSSQAPLLGAEEETRLAARVLEGDSEAREQLVRANLRLVVNIARTYTGKGLTLDDLIEEGNLGLLRAVEGFDPKMPTRFSVYASYWIKQSIKRALVNTAKTVRIPAYMVELLARWRRATAKLQEELGRAPTQDEVAQALQLPKKKLDIIKKAIRVSNLPTQSDQPEDVGALDEILLDEHTRTPDAEMVESDDLQHVLAALDKLDESEATVLRLRFGLDGEKPKTLKEIAEHAGMTREKVRQIEAEGISKLSESMHAH
jgi:RNA polymerase primary sigma factor